MKDSSYVHVLWIPAIHAGMTCLLTPLILSSFEPEGDSELDRRPLTASSIMDHTIRPILRRSHLVGLRLADGEAVAVLHAFTLIAWLFFYQHRGEIDIGHSGSRCSPQIVLAWPVLE